MHMHLKAYYSNINEEHKAEIVLLCMDAHLLPILLEQNKNGTSICRCPFSIFHSDFSLVTFLSLPTTKPSHLAAQMYRGKKAAFQW